MILTERETLNLAAYCCFPKKPCINVSRTIDTQLA